MWRSLAALAGGEPEKDPDFYINRSHTQRTTCVAISPNNQWVASCDVTGAIRLWGAKGDHVQKNEYKIWNGIIKDVSWSGDSTRIVASGEGKEVSAVALLADTGSKTGEVAGHAKQINSISFRSQRPFRIVTGSDDMGVNFHEGPPFKLKRSHTPHSNFVNAVRYSPDGEWAVSAGSDSKMVLFEGKDGEIVREFTKPDGISGSLWGAAWSPDSTRIVTAGGDKKLRIWDRETGAQLSELQVGTGSLDDMQVGIAWAATGRVVSCCLDGRILLSDVAADGTLKISTTVDGTQGSLNRVACDPKTGMLVRGGNDGSIAVLDKGATRRVKCGKGIDNIMAHSANFGGPSEVWVSALDHCVRRIALESGEVIGEPVEVKEKMIGCSWLEAAETKLLVVTSKSNFHCIGEKSIEWSKNGAIKRQPTAMAGMPGRAAVALEDAGASAGQAVQNLAFDIVLYDVGGSADSIVEKTTLSGHQNEVTALSFSPAGDFLASGDTRNKIFLWNLKGDPITKVEMLQHTARIAQFEWLPGGKHLVSGSLDCRVIVWNLEDPSKPKGKAIEQVHGGGVTALAACSEKSFASVGFDGFMLVHELE